MKGIVERFQYEAYTDGLTGVPNRSAFNTLIKTRFEFAKRANQPLTIVMVDVDGFKVAQRSIWPHSGRQSLTRCCQTSDQTCSGTECGGALWQRRICDCLPWIRPGGNQGSCKSLENCLPASAIGNKFRSCNVSIWWSNPTFLPHLQNCCISPVHISGLQTILDEPFFEKRFLLYIAHTRARRRIDSGETPILFYSTLHSLRSGLRCCLYLKYKIAIIWTASVKIIHKYIEKAHLLKDRHA